MTIALAGQPNVGKSTIFNLFTGLDQHVGNWPGKTVERKYGHLTRGRLRLEIVDLPGVYSLTARSPEEQVVRDCLLTEPPDVVALIVNAATLERNLYLAAELLELGVPLVIGVNMLDVAAQEGIVVRVDAIEQALGVPVVGLTASQAMGVADLLDRAIETARMAKADRSALASRSRPLPRPEHRPIIAQLIARLEGGGPWLCPVEWLAVKLLEGDADLMRRVQETLAPLARAEIEAIVHAHEDAFLDIIGGRYDWIRTVSLEAIARPRLDAVTLTDRLDRVATHPLWGVAALLATLAAVFGLVYGAAEPLVGWVTTGVNWLGLSAQALLSEAPAWLSGLVVQGLISGVGMVLTLVPVMVVFFGVLGLLEDVGYFPRAAYVMDRFMHVFGLHGTSFLPLFLGFGCNVPAVMGTRVLDDRRGRLVTTLLAPLVPCTQRIAVLALLAPAFFGARAAIISWALVAGNVLVLATVGWVAHRVAPGSGQTAFIMELPLYHVPNVRTLARFVWRNTWSFVEKAGTVIVVVAAAVWVLSYLPYGDAERSLLAGMARGLEPAGRLLGLGDWRVITALITSFVAKENTIATLGVLFADRIGEATLPVVVAQVLGPAASLSFLVVQMLFIPCVATVSAIRQEAGWRFALGSIALQLGISLGAGVLVYQLATLAAMR